MKKTARKAKALPKGTKFDDGKLRFDLISDEAERELAAVLTFGASKYSPDGWRHVPEAERRYYSALRRHLSAWRRKETQDRETGLRHLGHAMCCLMFLLALDAERAVLPDVEERLEEALRRLRASREGRGHPRAPGGP